MVRIRGSEFWGKRVLECRVQSVGLFLQDLVESLGLGANECWECLWKM